MTSLEFNCENIKVTREKKKLFGGVKVEETIISLSEINSARKEMFKEILNSVTIVLKNGQEEFITAEELLDGNMLNAMFELLLEKRVENNYQLEMIDIETLEETKL